MQQQLVAEAMVAVAFREQRPLLLMQAARAFRELEQAPGVSGGGSRVWHHLLMHSKEPKQVVLKPKPCLLQH